MVWFLALKKVNMLSWIKTLYSHQAIVNYRRLSFWKVILIVLLANLLVSMPFLMSAISQRSSEVLTQLPGFEEDFRVYLESNPNCTIGPNLNCEASQYEGDTYTIQTLPNSDLAELKNTVVLDAELFMIYDANEELIIYGYYPDLGLMTYSDFVSEIQQSSGAYLNDFLNAVLASLWVQRFMLQYLLLLVQNLIYLFVISGLFLFVSTLKPKPFNYKESLTMIAQLMFSPALLTAMFGMISLNLASFSFTTLLIIRIILLYQAIIYHKVKFINL